MVYGIWWIVDSGRSFSGLFLVFFNGSDLRFDIALISLNVRLKNFPENPCPWVSFRRVACRSASAPGYPPPGDSGTKMGPMEDRFHNMDPISAGFSAVLSIYP
jgi:hypothetical protein